MQIIAPCPCLWARLPNPTPPPTPQPTHLMLLYTSDEQESLSVDNLFWRWRVEKRSIKTRTSDWALGQYLPFDIVTTTITTNRWTQINRQTEQQKDQQTEQMTDQLMNQQTKQQTAQRTDHQKERGTVQRVYPEKLSIMHWYFGYCLILLTLPQFVGGANWFGLLSAPMCLYMEGANSFHFYHPKPRVSPHVSTPVPTKTICIQIRYDDEQLSDSWFKIDNMSQGPTNNFI